MGLERVIIVAIEAHDYDRGGDRAKGVAMQCGLAAAWSLCLDFVSPCLVLEPCFVLERSGIFHQVRTGQSLATAAVMGRRQH